MFEVGKIYINSLNPTLKHTCVMCDGEYAWLRTEGGYTTGKWNTHGWKEYREPVKVSGWVNVYKREQNITYLGNVYVSKHLAIGMKDHGAELVATVYVSGEEGKEP